MAVIPSSIRSNPLDENDRRLFANVHPDEWTNPEPAPRYNMVVIGAGTAGLVIAAGAAGLGAKVAIVERHLMGGDCLNFGCVPSKALIRSSRAVAEIHRAAELGVTAEVPGIRFASIMERMRRLRAGLSVNDSAARFRGLGVDVFFGDARFTAPDRIEVDGRELLFSRAAIATGTRPAAPPIQGLESAGYLTNVSVFSLVKMPRRLAIIGAGPIGCELAQAFARFGAEVSLLEVMPQVLPREDPDAAALIQGVLGRDGVRLITGCRVVEVKRKDDEKVITLSVRDKAETLAVDEILVGAGRAPNVEGLNLESAGIDHEASGIKVDDYLRTSNKRVYAAGDVCTPYKFTHIADATARIVIRNALFFGRARASRMIVPWCIYTDPEIAHVGMDEKEAAARGIGVATFTQPLGEVDRAAIDSEIEGFVKIHVARGTDRIVGATVVASHAGEMISEVSTAMAARVGLGALANVIHPYPTQAEAIRKLGDAYNRTRLTPRFRKMLLKWFAWRR